MIAKINVFIDNYVDKELTCQLFLGGIRGAAYRKKTVIRIFYSVDALLKSLEGESKRFVIVIIESKINSENLLWNLNKNGIHPIFINLQFFDNIYCYSRIMPNYFSAHYYLAQMVLDASPEPTAIVGYNHDSISDNLRLTGFKQAIEEYGVKSTINYNNGDISKCIEGVMDNIKHYKNILCCNDTTAFFIIQRLRGAGIDAAEYNITGSGNMAIGLYSSPSISTVAMDCYGMGSIAVDIYAFLYKKSRVDHVFIDMGSQVILRQSTHLKKEKPQDLPKPISKGGFIDFFGNEQVIKVNVLERMLEACDEVDIGIIQRILKGCTYEEICEINNLAINTLKYRIKKMKKNLGVRNRKELLEYFYNYDLSF